MQELIVYTHVALLTILTLEVFAFLFRLRLFPADRLQRVQRNQFLLLINLLVFIGLKTFLLYGSWEWIFISFFLLASWGNFTYYTRHRYWGRIFNLCWLCLGLVFSLIYLFGFFPQPQLVAFFFIILCCSISGVLGLQFLYFTETKTYLYLWFVLVTGLGLVAEICDFLLFQLLASSTGVSETHLWVGGNSLGVQRNSWGQLGHLAFACLLALVVAWQFVLKRNHDNSSLGDGGGEDASVGNSTTGDGGSKRELRQVVRRLEQTEENLFQQDRLIALGYLAAGTAHEFKNILNNLQLLLEYGLKQASPYEKDKSLTLMQENVQLASTSVTDLLESLAVTGREEVETIPVDKFIHHLFKVFNSSFKKTRILFKADVEKKITLEMRESELKQIIINLIWNAVQAFKMQQEEPVENFILLRAYQQQQLIILELIDNAGGVNEDLQGQLFKTTLVKKPSPTSTPASAVVNEPPSPYHKSGLGLYLAYNLTEKNNGQLEYIPLEHGSCFRLTFY